MERDLYEQEVRARIIRVREDGSSSFLDVLARVDGADPRLVRRILDDIETMQPVSTPDRWSVLSGIRSHLLDRLPAADPALGQWWYTPATQEQLTRRILDFCGGRSPFRVLCVGAPSLAPLLAEAGCDVDVAEIDSDVIAALRDACPKVNVVQCDLLKERLQIESVDLALVDSPWYKAEMMAFLRQGVQSLTLGGYLVVSLPPMLTRPTVAEERQNILQELQRQGADMVFLDHNTIRYVVPSFEESAFRDVTGFCGQAWRVADLLVCKKCREETWDLKEEHEEPGAITTNRYSRNPREFRVFTGNPARKADPRTVITRLEAFSGNVSRQPHGGLFPNVWTSEKTGALVEDMKEAQLILSCWQDGGDKSRAEQMLVETLHLEPGTARQVVEKYDQTLEIWSKYASGIGRRLPAEIKVAKESATTPWATSTARREHGKSPDGFRLEYPRDRDRVLWAGSFRKLAGKTQLFPVDGADQVRQRLAHSIEVMQLGGTIADSFGLDRDLVEAGALAHDIGHTPFGHAGEHALDRLLAEIAPTDSPGFNHYEHGVDVVRYLEGPYQYLPRSGHMGLNLTSEVCECVFKHTYCQGGSPISHDEIRKRSKHAGFLADGYCHLEGQAVRIADKVSYLVSDIEDGIRLDAVDEVAILSCRLFHRPPIDLTQPRGEPLLRRFLLQRRNLLRVLMEDIITETGRRLVRIGSLAAVQSHDSYVVDHSAALKADVNEVWDKLQVSRLHRDPRVIQANMRAARIVSELFLLVAMFPELVPEQFRREHSRLWSGPYLSFYKGLLTPKVQLPRNLIEFLLLDRYIGMAHDPRTTATVIQVEHLVMAKDYVASLSDDQARNFHKEYVG